jgi:hypothetical protein
MPRCEEWNHLLLDYAYDLLDADQVRQVREHLDGCADCQSGLQEALGQKALLARAARVYGDVPPFAPPTESIAVDREVDTPILPPQPAEKEAILPQGPTSSPPNRRRTRWAWVASAAAVLFFAVPFGYYRSGLASRQTLLAELRREVTDAESQLARAEVDFRKETHRLVTLAAVKDLRLQVTGPSVYHSEVENRYRVETADLEGNRLSAKVEARLLDDSKKEIFRSEALPVQGERVVSLPAGLEIPAWGNTCLEIRATTGKSSEELTEQVLTVPPEPLAQLSLNKRQYFVGEIVFFRSVMLDRYTLRPESKPRQLRHTLIDAKGKAVLELAKSTAAGGIAAGEFALTSDLAEGEYTLQVADATGRPLTVRPLRVVRDVPAGLYFGRPHYRPGDKVVASYQAPRSYKDAALANQAVTVNVLQNDGSPVDGLRQPIQVFTDQMGQANFEFQLPRYTPSAPARIEIQLQNGAPNEKLVREIPSAPINPQVEFFPEGGELLTDATNVIYFRATTAQGDPADVEGRVIDSRGHVIAEVKTEPHDAVRGLGAFSLTPRPGETYRFQIKSPTGAKSALALPEAKNAGAALHVENPVDAEGEPIRVTLRSGGVKQLLLVATCRERTVAQQFVTASDTPLATSLAPAAGARGTLRVTVYEVLTGGVSPLAERLVFREPSRWLALWATTDKFAYAPDESVRLRARSADENGAAAPAWLAALVVDERVLPDDPSNEQSMPAFFYLLSEVGQSRDLDNADVLLAPGEQSRRALDLFLGTHGWRRFVPAKGPADKTGWFHRDNRDALVRKRQQSLDGTRTSLETLRLKSAELRDREEGLRDRARLAYLDLTDFEQRPREFLGIGLGVLVSSLLFAGAVLLVWGLTVLVRGGAARPHFLVALALLGCCFITYVTFGNRPVGPDGPATLAWLQSKPHPDLNVPQQQGLPLIPKGETVPAALTRSRDNSPQSHVENQQVGQKVEFGLAMKDLGGKEKASQLMNSLDSAQTQFRFNSANSQTFSAKEVGEPLQARFQEAKLQQETARYFKQNMSTNPPSDKFMGNASGVNPPATSKTTEVITPTGVPATVPISPTPTDPKSSGGGAMPNAEFSQKQREYAHRNNRKGNDYQDTVFWHPALVTQGGEVQVTFDLSSIPTSYRVLLYGHTADGRLGGFQGRLTTRQPTLSPARKR